MNTTSLEPPKIKKQSTLKEVLAMIAGGATGWGVMHLLVTYWQNLKDFIRSALM
jgi:hypothetical protein